MTKAQYKTKQLLEIEDFLKENANKHVTVNDIILFFKEQGKNIGKATVYRHLERMVSDGSVHKYMLDAGDSACFEYIEDEDLHPVCFHCKCEKCGKLIHLECTELSLIGDHLREEHGFDIDHTRTVFYGTCNECRKEGKL